MFVYVNIVSRNGNSTWLKMQKKSNERIPISDSKIVRIWDTLSSGIKINKRDEC